MRERLTAIVQVIRVVIGTLYALVALSLPAAEIFIDSYTVSIVQFLALVAVGMGFLALDYSLVRLFSDIFPWRPPGTNPGNNGSSNGS